MLSQDLGGLRPAAQVLRARLVSETAEVDHPLDPLPLGHLGEVARGLALTLLEVALAAPSHSVHEVVGDLDTVARAAQRLGVENVSLDQLDPAFGELARTAPVAHEGADMPAVVGEGVGQPPADEAGGARDESGASVRTHQDPGIPAELFAVSRRRADQLVDRREVVGQDRRAVGQRGGVDHLVPGGGDVPTQRVEREL